MNKWSKMICGVSSVHFIVYIFAIAFSIVCIGCSFIKFGTDFQAQNLNSILTGIGTGVLTSIIIGWIFDIISNNETAKKITFSRHIYLNRSPLDFTDIAISNINFAIRYLPGYSAQFNGISVYQAILKIHEIVKRIWSSPDSKSNLYDNIESQFSGLDFLQNHSNFEAKRTNCLFEKNKCFINGILSESNNINTNSLALKTEGMFTDEEILKISSFSSWISDLSTKGVYLEYLESLEILYSMANEIEEIKTAISKTGNIKNGKFYVGDHTL